MHLHQDDPIGYYRHRSGDGATPACTQPCMSGVISVHYACNYIKWFTEKHILSCHLHPIISLPSFNPFPPLCRRPMLPSIAPACPPPPRRHRRIQRCMVYRSRFPHLPPMSLLSQPIAPLVSLHINTTASITSPPPSLDRRFTLPRLPLRTNQTMLPNPRLLATLAMQTNHLSNV